MTRTLQLGNAANWEQIYTHSQVAVQITPTVHAPIPEITVPLLIESHVLAVYLTTEIPEGRNWNFAGFLHQRFELGLTVGGMPEADDLSLRKLWLNRIKLIIFPKLTVGYSIAFNVPKWFKSVQLIVWEYTGTDSDSTEDLVEQIKNVDLPRIEAKVDSINQVLGD
jgi:hypothetical protein